MAKLGKIIGVRPIADTILGAKETGKSSLNEILAFQHEKIIDVFGSRDNEGLAWLRSPMNKNVLFLKSDTVDIDCNCADVKNTVDFRISDLDKYNLVISAAAFYSTIREEWRSVGELMDRLGRRQGWHELVCLVIREAANLLASRHILGEDQKQAVNQTIYFLRELRHSGFTVNVDTIRWFGIDRDVRAVTDYTFIKATGTEGLPQDLHFMYRYFNAFKIQQMKPNQFIVLSREGSIGTGTFDFPYWHKLEKENLLSKFDIRITYDRQTVHARENRNQKVSDLEHVRIIKIRLETQKSIEKIATELQRSPHTIHEHFRHHNNTRDVLGYCDRCQRANKQEYATRVVD
jgi:hypothetical protein